MGFRVSFRGLLLVFTGASLGSLQAHPTSPAINAKPPVAVLSDGRVRVEQGTNVHVLRQVRRAPRVEKAFPAAQDGGSVYPGCLVCHGDIENATAGMGFDLDCTFCHGGDPGALDKEFAHVRPTLPVFNDATVPPLDYDLPYQRFVNPSNLRVAEQTCGLCHATETREIKKSLMATAAGHYAGGLYQNNVVNTKTPIYGTFANQDQDGVVPTHRGAVQGLQDLIRYDPAGDPSKIGTHFAAVPGQACARCHLWSRGKGFRGAVGAEGVYRADGCAACHVLYASDGLSRSADRSLSRTQPGHPRFHAITKAVTTEQCLHCHHRGARIGLSFTGLSQMPPRLPSGPGVPGTTQERFNGDYHFADTNANPPDIHHQLGMHCIDCHTKAESEGDGNLYGHMDQATKIECETCHGRPGEMPTLQDNDGQPLWNLRQVGSDVVLTSKVTGRQHPVPLVKDVVNPQSPRFNPRAARAMDGHHIKAQGGLECYACHSAWMPTCYGCHFERDERQMGLNLVTRQQEFGKVRLDNRVFVTFRRFALGPNSEGRIAPYVVGCQTIADVTAPDGSKLFDFVMPATANGRSGLALNPVNPHTVRGHGDVRTCAECHRSPATLGLGSGNYNLARQRAFVAAADGVRVYDRRTDPRQPRLLGVLPVNQPLALAVQPNVVQGTADDLFVASRASGVSIFDLRNGLPPQPDATLPLRATDVSVAGRHLYVVVEGVGVNVYDIAQPTHPHWLATVPVPSAQRAVPWGIHLFVAAGPAGLVVLDMRNPQAPVLAGALPGINATALKLYAHYQVGPAFAVRAYVADPDFGVRVVDLTTSFARPRLVGRLELPGASGLDTYVRYQPADATKAASERDYLYVAAGTNGLHVYDITQPDAIAHVSELALVGGSARDVDVSSHLAPPGVDDYALVANEPLGLQVVNLNDPRRPALVGTVAAPGVRALLVEVQLMDRFLDEQCNELKENSHPFISNPTRPGMELILSVPDVAEFVDRIFITAIQAGEKQVRVLFRGLAREPSGYALEGAASLLGPWRAQSNAVIIALGDDRFEATLPTPGGPTRFFQIRRTQ